MKRLSKFFDDNHIFWTTLGIWSFLQILFIPLMVQGLFYFFIGIPVIVFLYVVLPFSFINRVSKRFFSQDDLHERTLWQGNSPEADRNFLIVFIVYLEIYFTLGYFVGFLFLPLLIIGIFILVFCWKKDWVLISQPKTAEWKEYFKRLNIGQISTLAFMFVLLAGSSHFLGYLLVFVFVGATLIRGDIKNSEIGIRYYNPLLLIFLTFCGIMGNFTANFIVTFLGDSSVTSTGPLINILYGYLVVGFAEELIWRVFLQTFLERHLGGQKAIVVTALLFMLVHLPKNLAGGLILVLPNLLLVLYSGLIWGFLWYKSRSLPVITGGHLLVDSGPAIFNTIFNLIQI